MSLFPKKKVEYPFNISVSILDIALCECKGQGNFGFVTPVQ